MTKDLRKAINAVLEGWFGEAIENMDDEKRVRKFLLDPLVKAATPPADPPSVERDDLSPDNQQGVREALRAKINEMNILVREYDTSNSDWAFRSGVMLTVLTDMCRDLDSAALASAGTKSEGGLTFVPITGPGVDAFNNRKETGQLHEVTIAEERASIDKVVDGNLASMKILAEKNFDPSPAFPGAGVREMIARIIDPDNWHLFDCANNVTLMKRPVSEWRVETSLSKADAILSALSDRQLLRNIVDAAYCHAMEPPCFPATKTADMIIDAVLAGKPAESVLGSMHLARWRHKKRGSSYTEVARGPLQASTRPPAEDDIIVAYRGADGRWFFREATEFDDGRFEPAKERGNG